MKKVPVFRRTNTNSEITDLFIKATEKPATHMDWREEWYPKQKDPLIQLVDNPFTFAERNIKCSSLGSNVAHGIPTEGSGTNQTMMADEENAHHRSTIILTR